MAKHEHFEDSIGRWLMDTAPARLPARVLDATFETTRRTRQDTGWRAILQPAGLDRRIPALATAVIVVMVASLVMVELVPVLGPGGTPRPTVTPTAAAAAGRFASCTELFEPEEGVLLACSRDGTRLLVQRDKENLFILDLSGSETLVTDQLSGIARFVGSARPAGAAISPDGSRVVFAGLAKAPEDAESCHDGALFLVDADGGPAELVFRSQSEHNGIVRYPAFSPDGTRVAFSDGYCDSDHSVWLMNADGSDAQRIVSMEAAGWVRGVGWSPDGDRIALLFDSPEAGGVYTFAPDGSGLARRTDAGPICWPRVRC